MRRMFAPLAVVCGPSGVGKGTLVKKLISTEPENFCFGISHTTRPPRHGEVNGVDYYFVTPDEFEKVLKSDGFLENAIVHGNFYGTSKQTVLDASALGKICILDIDIQGAQKVRRSSFKSFSVFVLPPSYEELERRLRARGTETEDRLQLRLRNALTEMEFCRLNTGFGEESIFDFAIVNDDFDRCYAELRELIRYHLKV